MSLHCIDRNLTHFIAQHAIKKNAITRCLSKDIFLKLFRCSSIYSTSPAVTFILTKIKTYQNVTKCLTAPSTQTATSVKLPSSFSRKERVIWASRDCLTLKIPIRTIETPGGEMGARVYLPYMCRPYAFKSWSYFRPKKIIFYTLFETKLQKSIL